MLSKEEQDAILALKSEAPRFTPGRDLVRPSETIGHATLVASGNVGRFDLMRNGARQITAIYMAGDMCDLYSVVAPTTSWGLTALGNCSVHRVAHADLRGLAEAYPGLAQAFWRVTVLDASILAKWIGNIGRKDARARIAHLLCELGIRMERAGLGQRDSYALALTQEHIGDAMGLTSVHVNRTLQRLKAEEVVTLHGHHVTVGDRDRLVAIAEFTPTFLLCGEE